MGEYPKKKEMVLGFFLLYFSREKRLMAYLEEKKHSNSNHNTNRKTQTKYAQNQTGNAKIHRG